MRVHYSDKCKSIRWNSWLPEVTNIYSKVTCKKCLHEYHLEQPIYIVKKNGFLNVVAGMPTKGWDLVEIKKLKDFGR